jgi:hypothetical protein
VWWKARSRFDTSPERKRRFAWIPAFAGMTGARFMAETQKLIGISLEGSVG